jgi:hypothetical protein
MLHIHANELLDRQTAPRDLFGHTGGLLQMQTGLFYSHEHFLRVISTSIYNVNDVGTLLAKGHRTIYTADESV